jgi:hypothetical protein
VKASESYAGLYCTIELNEVLNGQVVWFSPRGRLDRKGGKVVAEPFEDPPGHPQTRMRAYLTREDGALAYVAFVAGGRYASAWQHLLVGDAVGYVTELRAKGYFTAPLADYLKGVVALQREFLGKLNGQHPEPASVPPPPPHPRPTLKLGASGPEVEEMQRALNKFGATLKVDGSFRQKSAAALAKFQRANNLIGDSVCGPATWAKLGLA